MSPDHGAMVPAHGAGQIGVVVGGTVWDEVRITPGPRPHARSCSC